jgi:hypothetical protein
MRTRSGTTAVEAEVGYAADEHGRGVAYARIGSDGEARLLRVTFRTGRAAAAENGAGYAALAAVARELRERGVNRASFAVDDPQLVEEVNERRKVPAAIVLPYVRLRCALNQFVRFELRTAGGSGDLAQRARAEVALHVAA